ncbi:hypothetical protein BT63DRAFT_269047 [Microthyrium microscopicum]|uniref:Uncharacterized protein n=1 Tax=Microthyrium microscopicum TaxID=703497 RepID=A0A6A6UA03_9PEZI|nr:hypothetical protein BT63DRAFT_269047 [Microthyrium microscopicum]
MPKIPPQSEPVDAKELYKRLEVVYRQQETRLRRRTLVHELLPIDSNLSVETSLSAPLSSSLNPPGDYSYGDYSYDIATDLGADFGNTAPLPPTALPTRPTSFLPPANEPLPQSLQLLNRLSTFGEPRNNRHTLQANHAASNNRHTLQPNYPLADLFSSKLSNELQDVGQAARLGAKSNSRPSTSWNAEKHSRQIHKEEEDDATELNISGHPQRPKSLYNMQALNSHPVKFTDGTGIIKHESLREVQSVPQPVQIVNHEHTMPRIAPVSSIKDDFHAFNLEPPAVARDGYTTTGSGLSSATTIAQGHSASSSKSNRKSWNPKSFISRMKERRSGPDQPIPVPILREQFSASIPNLHEIVVEPETLARPDMPNFGHSAPVVPQWERPIPRPQTTAFAPFKFEDYRFSGVSDFGSLRDSDPNGHFRLSDLDSGLGLSDTGSSAGAEEMPTLMPGAEKRPDWNKIDTSRKRDSTMLLQSRAPGESGSPTKKAYRESALRQEVASQDEFAFDSSLDDSFHSFDHSFDLQDEPPEDEGVFVSFPQEPLTPEPDYGAHEPTHHVRTISASAPITPPPVPEKTTKANKRKTLDPRQLFSSTRTSSVKQSDPSTPPSRSRSNRYTMSHSSSHAVSSPRDTRPSSRSQPIVIAPHTEEPMPDTNSYLYDPTNQSHSISQRSHRSQNSSKMHSTRASMHSPLPPADLNIPPPPPVPAKELAKMTPASIAFLREQEKLLMRRSTMQHSNSYMQEKFRAFDDQGEIGVAFSPATPFTGVDSASSNTHTPRISSSLGYSQYGSYQSYQSPAEQQTSFSQSMNTRFALASSPPPESAAQSVRGIVTSPHTRQGSVNYHGMSSTRKALGRHMPQATTSMMELDKSTGKIAPPKQKKKRWWKVWKLV